MAYVYDGTYSTVADAIAGESSLTYNQWIHEWLMEDVEYPAGTILPRMDMNRKGFNNIEDVLAWLYDRDEWDYSAFSSYPDYIHDMILVPLAADIALVEVCSVDCETYNIPTDNPFVNSLYKEGQAEEAPYRPEIWAMGFRNPWRFSFDTSGRLWVADVGQDKFEEINIVEKGGNYGWRVIEGYHDYETDPEIVDQIAIDLGHASTLDFLLSLKRPVHEYSHGTGISILGGFVYRGALAS